MPYRFKRKESVSGSIERLSRQCVDKAVKHSREANLESIHSTRKEIKKLRAVLRLIKSEIGKRSFECRMDCLREAAGYLAPARDAHVKANAFEHLIRPANRRRRNGSAPVRFGNIPYSLKKDCDEEVQRFREQNCAKLVRRILRKEPAQFKKLKIQNEGWASLGPGLEQSYRAARATRDEAEAQPSAENFHEWRKRVKDLWYNIQLLHPIWPEQMCAAAAELEKLSELLGDDHDLHMLAQTAIKKSVNRDLESEAHQLLEIIGARKPELQTEALKLGRSFFQEKPADFCRRLHGYWKLWKSKKKRRKRQQRQPADEAAV